MKKRLIKKTDQFGGVFYKTETFNGFIWSHVNDSVEMDYDKALAKFEKVCRLDEDIQVLQEAEV